MSIFVFADHTLDLKQGRLRNGAGDVTLRPKSLALLTYLVKNPGRIIDKHELIAAVWPDVVVSDDSLSQCLKDIRAVLGPGAEGFIRTVPRRGYILDEERVRAVDERDAARADKAPTASEKPSIAILPFETADADQEWFSAGIAEDITMALAKSRRLRVVSKNYSFAFKGRGMRGDEIARELGVGYLLEGSVRLSERQVRVSTRLIESASGEVLWADRFDQEPADIFVIQDKIAEAVARHLELELLPEEQHAIQQARTTNIEAYHYELRGRQLALHLTKPYLKLARRMFAKAVELDPGYARAYAGMTVCDCYLRDWHGEGIGADAILAFADKAIELDANLPEAHAARGFALFCGKRYEEAEQAYQTALSIDPNSWDANFLSAETIARSAGDRERLIRTFTLTARLRPDDYFSPMLVASVLATDDPERQRWARICFERSERLAKLHPDNAGHFHRGAVALAYLGKRERAHSWLARALAIDPDDFVTLYNAACAHSVLGETEKAIEYLESALLLGTLHLREKIRTDADMDGIRDHPRFSLLLREREV